MQTEHPLRSWIFSSGFSPRAGRFVVAASMLLTLSLVGSPPLRAKEFTLTGTADASAVHLGGRVPVNFSTSDGTYSFIFILNVVDNDNIPYTYDFRGHLRPKAFALDRAVNREQEEITISMTLDTSNRALRAMKKSIAQVETEAPVLDVDFHWLRDIPLVYDVSYADRSLFAKVKLPSDQVWQATSSGELWEIMTTLHAKGILQRGRVRLDFTSSTPERAFPGLVDRRRIKEQPWRIVHAQDECGSTLESPTGLPKEAAFRNGKYEAVFDVPNGDFSICFANAPLFAFDNQLTDPEADIETVGVYNRGDLQFRVQAGHPQLVWKITWKELVKAKSEPLKTGLIRSVPYQVARVGARELSELTSSPKIWIPPFPDLSDRQHRFEITLRRPGSSTTKILSLWVDIAPLETGTTPVVTTWDDRTYTDESFPLLLKESQLRDPPEELRISVKYPQIELLSKILRIENGEDAYHLPLPREARKGKVRLRNKDLNEIPFWIEGSDLLIDRFQYTDEQRELYFYVQYRWPIDLYLTPPPPLPKQNLIPLDPYDWVVEGGEGAARWQKVLEEKQLYLNALQVPLPSSATLQESGPEILSAALRNRATGANLLDIRIETGEAVDEHESPGYQTADRNPEIRREGTILLISRSTFERAMNDGTTMEITLRHITKKEEYSWRLVLTWGLGVAIAVILLSAISAIIPRLRNAEHSVQIDEDGFGEFGSPSTETESATRADGDAREEYPQEDSNDV